MVFLTLFLYLFLHQQIFVIMAYIKTLKDNELIGGQDNTDVYPVSTTQAIFSQKPDGTVPEGIKHQRLEERLEDNEEDTKNLTIR
jgi:hypothetical protein